MNLTPLLLLALSAALIGTATNNWHRLLYKDGKGRNDLPFGAYTLIGYAGLIASAFLFSWWTPLLAFLLCMPVGVLLSYSSLSNGGMAFVGTVIMASTLIWGA